jgi:hypothetical protein
MPWRYDQPSYKRHEIVRFCMGRVRWWTYDAGEDEGGEGDEGEEEGGGEHKVPAGDPDLAVDVPLAFALGLALAPLYTPMKEEEAEDEGGGDAGHHAAGFTQ